MIAFINYSLICLKLRPFPAGHEPTLTDHKPKCKVFLLAYFAVVGDPLLRGRSCPLEEPPNALNGDA